MLHLKAKAALRQGTPGMPTAAQESQELQTVLDSFDSFDPPNDNSTSKIPCMPHDFFIRGNFFEMNQLLQLQK